MTIVPLQPDAAGLVNLDDLDNMFAAVEAEVVTAHPPASNNAASLPSGGGGGDSGDSSNNGSSGTASANPPPAIRFGQNKPAAVTPNAAPKKARKPWAPPVLDSGASPFSVVKFKRSPPRDQVSDGALVDVPCSFLGDCQCKNCA
jgi:hypothetical protein